MGTSALPKIHIERQESHHYILGVDNGDIRPIISHLISDMFAADTECVPRNAYAVVQSISSYTVHDDVAGHGINTTR